MKVYIKKEFAYSPKGWDNKICEGGKVHDIPEHLAKVLLERGDASKVEEAKKQVSEPEENKLMAGEENKSEVPKVEKKTEEKKQASEPKKRGRTAKAK